MGFCAPRYKRPVAKKASVSWIRTRNGRGPHGFHCPCRLVPPISTVVYYGSTDVIWLNFLATSQRPQPISVNDCDSTRKDSIIEEMDNVFELCMWVLYDICVTYCYMFHCFIAKTGIIAVFLRRFTVGWHLFPPPGNASNALLTANHFEVLVLQVHPYKLI